VSAASGLVPRPTFVLAAGGTGGHLFPAQALAEELGRRGIAVELATDTRGDRYGTGFPARRVHRIAWRAGMKQAMAETVKNSSDTAAKVKASVGLVA